MTTLMLRYHVADDDVQTVVRAVEAAFAGLRDERPEGLRFTYFRVAETAEFVGLVELADGRDNPLPALEATRALKAVVDRVAAGGPPTPQPLHVLGAYGR
ncbi:MAG: hypothetical protein KIS78_01575 [Labilithrix sp.]|nr:hypothetical protein [Labilithrix sp.]MCW5831131.1 hypothetical protein [Labilithrix sp.]